MFFIKLLLNIDANVGASLYASRNELLVKIFTWITFLGEVSTIVILTTLVSFFLWRLHKKNWLFGLWTVVVGSAIFTYVAKIFFDRPRPLNGVLVETSNSFPSGHATLAVAFYGFLAYLLFKQTKNKIYRLSIILISLLVILAIGFSRLYLGVHYFSDVLGGYLVGLLWLLAAVVFNEKTTKY